MNQYPGKGTNIHTTEYIKPVTYSEVLVVDVGPSPGMARECYNEDTAFWGPVPGRTR
jgi:hypothetical protein